MSTITAAPVRTMGLTLDDDIREYLEGDYPNLAFERKPIRIHHLVNHVSGLPRLLPDKPEAAPSFQSNIPYPQRLRMLVAATTRPDFYAGLHRMQTRWLFHKCRFVHSGPSSIPCMRK